MTRLRIALLTAAAAFAATCASAPPTKPNEKEWTALRAEYAHLEALRSSAPVPPPDASRKTRIEVLLETTHTLQPTYDQVLGHMREYFERTSDPRAARVLATEKIRIGDQYMNVLSRYDRAYNYFQEALELESANTEAQARLAEAQARRFVEIDRFSSVSSGMKEDRVSNLLGMPREDWIRQVTKSDRVYTVWIYPKEDGGAAAIYFQDGVVYHTNWNAAPSGGGHE